MKKTPTIFARDWLGDRSRVLDSPHPDCGWVFAGEGVPTRKIDGTCCLVKDGVLWKRREVKKGQKVPDDFVLSSEDEETGKTVGWVPVGEGEEDRWHREAFAAQPDLVDATYELVGPKIQGNPEGVSAHTLVMHGDGIAGMLDEMPRTFEGLKQYFATHDYEGIVFHHADGRMAKIKARDFGIKRA